MHEVKGSGLAGVNAGAAYVEAAKAMHCKPPMDSMAGSVAGWTHWLAELLCKLQLAPVGLGSVAGSVLGPAAEDSDGAETHVPGAAVGMPTRVGAHYGT